MKLKPFFKIGKSTTIRMTLPQTPVSSITTCRKVFDINICQNCPFYKDNTGYCSKHCKKPYKYVPERNVLDESSQIDSHFKKRLSRLQKLQFLLYHALDVGKGGFIKNVSEKEIANILDCTVKTVRNNNKRLSELHYIAFSKITSDRFNVLIYDYNTYHLSAKEGGHGYIVMSVDLLMELIKIKNVNALRLELRKLVKFDDYNIKTTKPKPVKYTYKEISNFLPSYINYKAKIEEIMQKTPNTFDVAKTENGIKFKLKNIYNGKIIKKGLQRKYNSYIQNYCTRKGIVLREGECEDLVQMSFEYRFNVVMEAFAEVNEDYIQKGDKYIKNFGGLVREIIEKNISRKKVSA